MSTAPLIPAFKPRRTSMRSSFADRIGIGHVLVDNCSFEQAAAAITSYAIADGSPAYVITANAQHVVLLDEDVRLREIYEGADLIVPDGISLILAARLFGRHLSGRVAGVDLFQRLCELAAYHGLRVFLLGGRPGSADLTADKLRIRYPGLQVTTYCPPIGFDQNVEEARRIEKAVHANRPHLLFVGFGAPKQEYWIFEHGVRLGAAVSIGVGGSFEMVAGVVQRAPVWVQNFGCEWLYRLGMEPRRMWRRYLLGNLQFCNIIVNQRMRRAYLSTLFALLRQQRFAAELKEPASRKETGALISRLVDIANGRASSTGRILTLPNKNSERKT